MALMMALYSLLLTLVLVAGAPFWLLRMATTGRYRAGLGQRLGRVPRALRRAVAGRRVVWMHAVSVGEVLAVERLVAELGQALPGWALAVSTTTATGQAMARQRLAGCAVFYLPLDFDFAVRAYLRVLRPEMLVLVESELWPRLLDTCRQRGVRVVVVNARMSDRSLRRTLPLRKLWLRMTEPVTMFLAQGVETERRLLALGVAPERVQSPGNLKFDPPVHSAASADENRMTRRLGSLLFGARLVVCGSTLTGEEAMLLGNWPEVIAAVPDAVLLLAPRHPERFAEVRQMLREARIPHWSCKHLLTATEPVFGGMVLLLDTLGDLASVYALASVAFVGGSLVARGGHNPLEAARFGVPVLMGPSYENFREIVDEMRAAGAVRIVERPALAEALIEALKGERPRTPFTGQTGATARTVEALLQLLPAAVQEVG